MVVDVNAPSNQPCSNTPHSRYQIIIIITKIVAFYTHKIHMVSYNFKEALRRYGFDDVTGIALVDIKTTIRKVVHSVLVEDVATILIEASYL